jgi:hypothetical protein
MKLNLFQQSMLALIALFLGIIALHPLLKPPTVRAQSERSHFYIEPGVYMLRAPDGSRQVMGKVMIDLTTGKVWGFPTLTDQPYPVDSTKTTPPTSYPVYLGKFELNANSSQ